MRGGAGNDEGGGDRASTNVPIAPRDASDGRVSGLVFHSVTISVVPYVFPELHPPRSGCLPNAHSFFGIIVEAIKFTSSNAHMFVPLALDL